MTLKLLSIILTAISVLCAIAVVLILVFWQ